MGLIYKFKYKGFDGTPAAAGSATYPNEPAGTSLIFQADTTVVEDGSGDAWGVSGVGGWEYDATSLSDVLTSVADATNPADSGYVTRFHWRGDRNPRCASKTFGFGASYSELYVMFRIYFEAGWTENTKYFFFGLSGGSATGFYTDGAPAGSGNLRIVCQNGDNFEIIDSGDTNANGTGAFPMENGTWLNVEMHIVDESSSGADDGEAYLWVNDTLVGSVTGLNLVTGAGSGFNTMRWYGDSNSSENDVYYRIGELYVAGIS